MYTSLETYRIKQKILAGVFNFHNHVIESHIKAVLIFVSFFKIWYGLEKIRSLKCQSSFVRMTIPTVYATNIYDIIIYAGLNTNMVNCWQQLLFRSNWMHDHGFFWDNNKPSVTKRTFPFPQYKIVSFWREYLGWADRIFPLLDVYSVAR